MTSSNGDIFRVTGPLQGEFIGHRWIPLPKGSDAEIWFFLYLRLNKRLSKQTRRWWFETPSCLSWRYFNGYIILLGNPVTHDNVTWGRIPYYCSFVTASTGVILNNLLKKRSSRRWLEAPCDATVICRWNLSGPNLIMGTGDFTGLTGYPYASPSNDHQVDLNFLYAVLDGTP